MVSTAKAEAATLVYEARREVSAKRCARKSAGNSTAAEIEQLARARAKSPSHVRAREISAGIAAGTHVPASRSGTRTSGKSGTRTSGKRTREQQDEYNRKRRLARMH